MFVGSAKKPVQEPLTGGDVAKDPESLAVIGFDAVVVAPFGRAFPPATFDPLGTCKTGDVVRLILPAKHQRRTIGGNRVDRQCSWLFE